MLWAPILAFVPHALPVKLCLLRWHALGELLRQPTCAFCCSVREVRFAEMLRGFLAFHPSTKPKIVSGSVPNWCPLNGWFKLLIAFAYRKHRHFTFIANNGGLRGKWRTLRQAKFFNYTDVSYLLLPVEQ